ILAASVFKLQTRVKDHVKMLRQDQCILKGPPSKRVRRSTLRVGIRRVTTVTCGSGEGCSYG
ncbi:hypothetical protein Tco_1518897, partial [Tanacetum coccineum]